MQLAGRDPKEAMLDLNEWVLAHNGNGRPVFVSDNPSYDFSFYNWYSHHFTGTNPFGYSGRRIGDLYCGLVKDVFVFSI